MAAFQQTEYRCNIEFLRSSKPGVGRVIRFNHSPEELPHQLVGRISLEAWQDFMRDVDSLAASHPYVGRPGAKEYGKWSLSFLMGAVVGLFCINPDAGDYSEWEHNAKTVISKYFGMFAEAGCQISLRNAGRNYWIQIDLDPTRVPPKPIAPNRIPEAEMTGKPIPSPFASSKVI